MTLVRRALLFAILTLGFSGTSFAQATAGTPPFGAFGGGPADVVNLANLNVHIDIPVLHKAGRGVPFNYDMTYDTSLWAPPKRFGKFGMAAIRPSELVFRVVFPSTGRSADSSREFELLRVAISDWGQSVIWFHLL